MGFHGIVLGVFLLGFLVVLFLFSTKRLRTVGENFRWSLKKRPKKMKADESAIQITDSD